MYQHLPAVCPMPAVFRPSQQAVSESACKWLPRWARQGRVAHACALCMQHTLESIASASAKPQEEA